jgi:hypothetical protein
MTTSSCLSLIGLAVAAMHSSHLRGEPIHPPPPDDDLYVGDVASETTPFARIPDPLGLPPSNQLVRLISLFVGLRMNLAPQARISRLAGRYTELIVHLLFVLLEVFEIFSSFSRYNPLYVTCTRLWGMESSRLSFSPLTLIV